LRPIPRPAGAPRSWSRGNALPPHRRRSPA
jgi:hypothetical protein